jgi:hypothetical protein
VVFFFGSPGSRARRVSVGAFWWPVRAYAVGSVMVYSFDHAAVERGMKVDMLMRVMPVPPTVYPGWSSRPWSSLVSWC